MVKQETACCSVSSRKSNNKFGESFVISSKITSAGFIPVITGEISSKDKLEHAKCRISKFRDDYQVNPGLYALGNPDKNSDVFVSANYKLSFDALRKELKGLDCWILVLNTKGINVWCAAGKGTFGTDELINRINLCKLEKIIEHKKIIVPQLGAVGVAAHEIKKETGFKVIYGPVRAENIKSFIDNDYTCSTEMRTVKFPFKDRIVLTPFEVMYYSKCFVIPAIVIILLFGLKSQGILFNPVLTQGLPIVIACYLAILIGTVAVPAALPTIPFNSFALKGALAGLIIPLITTFSGNCFSVFWNVYILFAVWLLLPAISSFTALQFTGSSTYTSPSGVEKELKIALPIYGTIAAIIIILVIIFKINTWN